MTEAEAQKKYYRPAPAAKNDAAKSNGQTAANSKK
jgi:hypothetical protein